MIATVHSSRFQDKFWASKRCLCVALLILGMPCLIFAQATSTVQGQITDPSGAPLSERPSKPLMRARGFPRTVQSAGDGFYRIPDLLPGNYQVRVEVSRL